MKYDIFISYRRKGGSERAELLKVILEKRGYKSNRVFMDTHSLLGGDFKQRIKDAISQSVNVVVLITEGCFDNIKDEDYWILELSEALSLKKNIIPVFFDGINSIESQNLPLILKDLPYQNAVSYNHEYADAFYSKLCSFLQQDKLYKKSSLIKNSIIGCCIFALIATIITYIYTPFNKETISVVDLGLPSGTIWGTCNLGADNKYDDGMLYAWGSIMPFQKQSSATIEHYEKIIGTSYDPASIALGDQWKLPSETQIAELISTCKWVWQNTDEHCGYLVIGPNGNSMFLPAAGCIIGEEIQYKGQFGYYWTGESHTKNLVFAKELLFGINQINIENGKKNVGRSIRAVYVKE